MNDNKYNIYGYYREGDPVLVDQRELLEVVEQEGQVEDKLNYWIRKNIFRPRYYAIFVTEEVVVTRWYITMDLGGENEVED